MNKKSPEQKNNENLLPGLKPALELLESDPLRIDQMFIRKGHSNVRLLDLCREKHVRFALVGDDALARLAGGVQHQGVIARLRTTSAMVYEDMLEMAFEAPLPLIIALDQVLDPGNVGTLARTMYALGCAGLVVPLHNSAYLGPGAHRSAAGALEKLPLAEVVNLGKAVELAGMSGFHTYYADMDGENALSAPLEFPAMLVLGSEESGVRPGVRRHCTTSLAIPFLRDFDSLNVAQAGGILASCFLRGKLL